MSRYQTPKPSEMFSDATSPSEIATRYDAFQAELNKSLSTPRPLPGAAGPAIAKQIDERRDVLSKSVSPQTIDSVRNALAQTDLNKDWLTNSPLSTGLVAYDLATPALMLTPRPTPLRNRIPRRPGTGLNHQFKRILGFSGTRTGGAAGGLINPGIDETTTNTFGPGALPYARGKKIQYAADEKFVPYVQCGLSDEVSWAAQFAGQGTFEDIRQLSSQSLLWSSMLMEENLLLGGRGTRTGFAGALAAPTNATLVVRNAGTNEVGSSGAIANLFVRITSVGVWGESASSAEFTTTLVNASGKVVDVSFTDAPGALGYHVYVGTTSGAANCFAAAVSNSSATLNVAPLAAGSSVPGQPITIHFNGGGTGGAPNTGATAPTSDTTAYENNYDGLLTYCTDPNQAGYVKRLNAPLSAAGSVYANNIGGEFEDAFAAMYDNNKADPDEIFCSGRDRKQLSDLLKTQNSSAYRIVLTNEESHDGQVGSVINGLYNPVTGKLVDVTVHPWLPQGNMPIVSWTLPIPDSNVSECFGVHAPQDLMQINWPVSQYYYEASTYWFSSLVAYAPAWSGCIQGVFRA